MKQHGQQRSASHKEKLFSLRRMNPKGGGGGGGGGGGVILKREATPRDVRPLMLSYTIFDLLLLYLSVYLVPDTL